MEFEILVDLLKGWERVKGTPDNFGYLHYQKEDGSTGIVRSGRWRPTENSEPKD